MFGHWNHRQCPDLLTFTTLLIFRKSCFAPRQANPEISERVVIKEDREIALGRRQRNLLELPNKDAAPVHVLGERVGSRSRVSLVSFGGHVVAAGSRCKCAPSDNVHARPRFDPSQGPEWVMLWAEIELQLKAMIRGRYLRSELRPFRRKFLPE